MKKFFVGFITYFLVQISAVCQSDLYYGSAENIFKNTVYGTLGVMPNVAYNLNFERRLTNSAKDTNSINLRIGYGGSGNLGGSEKMILLSSNFIFGNGAGHMEIDLGAAYLFDIVRSDTDDATGFTPVINFGYRFQKRTGQFVFRIGAGWPDCIYLSLGFAL